MINPKLTFSLVPLCLALGCGSVDPGLFGNSGGVGGDGGDGSGGAGNLGVGGAGNVSVGGAGNSSNGGAANGGAANGGAANGGAANGGAGNTGNVGPGVGGGPIGCSHDVCETGPALDPGCSPCVANICAADTYCCDTEWDPQCVGAVPQFCGQTCGGGGCASCSEVLNGSDETPCPGSDALIEAVLTCICLTDCAPSCSSACNNGTEAPPECQMCIQAECGGELTACFND